MALQPWITLAGQGNMHASWTENMSHEGKLSRVSCLQIGQLRLTELTRIHGLRLQVKCLCHFTLVNLIY